MADKDVQITAGKRNDITVVAEDKNWRDYVGKELKSADAWSKDWGFLASGAIEGKNNFCNLYVFRGQRASSEIKGREDR